MTARRQTREREKDDVVVAECQTMEGSSQRSGTPAHRGGQREDAECGREYPLMDRQKFLEFPLSSRNKNEFDISRISEDIYKAGSLQYPSLTGTRMAYLFIFVPSPLKTIQCMGFPATHMKSGRILNKLLS